MGYIPTSWNNGDIITDIKMNKIELQLAQDSTSIQDLLNYISEEYDSEKTYPVGSYVYHMNKLYRCKVAITTPSNVWTDVKSNWEEVTNIGEELRNVQGSESQINKDVISAAFMENIPYTLTMGSELIADTGTHDNHQSAYARTAMNPIPSEKSAIITVLDSDYEFIVWAYSDNASPSTGTYSPTNQQYTSGWAVVPYSTESVAFRVGFRRKDLADLTTGSDAATDESKLKAAIRFVTIPSTAEKAFFSSLNRACVSIGGSYHPYMRQGGASAGSTTGNILTESMSLKRCCIPADSLLVMKKGDKILNDGLRLTVQKMTYTPLGMKRETYWGNILTDFIIAESGLYHIVAQNVDTSTVIPVAEARQKITIEHQPDHSIYDLPKNPYSRIAWVTNSDTGLLEWSSRIKDIKSTTHLHTTNAVSFRRAVDARYDHIAVSNYHPAVPTVPMSEILPTLPSYHADQHIVPDNWLESPNAENVYFTDAEDYVPSGSSANHLHLNSVGSYLATGGESTEAGSGGFGGTLKEFSLEAEQLLKYPNGGGLTINHPISTGLDVDHVIKILSLGNVFGMEVYHYGSSGAQVADELWDGVLAKGWQVYGLGVPDHSLEGGIYTTDWHNCGPLGFVHLLCSTKDEQEILMAYRNGRFYTTIYNDTLLLKYFGMNENGLVTFNASLPGTIKFVTAARTVTVENTSSATFQTADDDIYVRAEIEADVTMENFEVYNYTSKTNEYFNIEHTNRLFTNAIMLGIINK